MDSFDAYIVKLVARGALVSAEYVADRVARDDAENPLGRRRRNIAATLHRLERRGYLQTRPITYAASRGQPSGGAHANLHAGRVVFDTGYYVTPRASRELNVPLPPNIREAFVDHHVQTLNAVRHLEDHYRAQGISVVGFRTESQLIREDFAGKTFDSRYRQRLATENGSVSLKYADAVVTIRHPDGHSEDVSVEYVSSKYTDDQIREKHKAFTGRVVWAVSSSATAARVTAITGEEPLVL